MAVFTGARDTSIDVAATPLSASELELATAVLTDLEAKIDDDITPCPNVQDQLYGPHLQQAARDVAASPLAKLVLRPARLEVTPTQADVHFRASALDFSLRRAGWDIDPGWVPYVGRVIRFHYDNGGGQ